MLEGFLVIDKPQGMTSATVIRRIKSVVPKDTKIGHAGTLDPNVTGVLPLAFGRATKAFGFLDNSVKKYSVTMQFGLATDTEDIWGTVTKKQPCSPIEKQDVLTCLDQFIGENNQVPPMYSAKKIDGKKLYEHARNGLVVERLSHTITIHSMTFIDYNHPHLTFDVTCSRGTYIRTLCVDLALRLGTIGTMTRLRRISTAGFVESMAHPLDDIVSSPLTLQDKLLPTLTLFKDYPRVEVDFVHAKHLTHGVKVNLMRFIPSKNRDNVALHSYFAVFFQNVFIGIAKRQSEDTIYLKQVFISPSEFDLREETL